MNFSDKITILRKHNNLTQQQFATKLNVSRQAVQKWESGDSFPDINKLPMISKEFGISVDDLLDQHLTSVELQKKLMGIEPTEDIVELAKKATKTDWFIWSSIVLGTSIYIGLLHIIGLILFLLFILITTGLFGVGLYGVGNAFYNLQNGFDVLLVNISTSFITIPLSILLLDLQRRIIIGYSNFTKKVVARIQSYMKARGVNIHEA